MDPSDQPQRLHPNIKTVWAFGGLVGAVILAALALGVELATGGVPGLPLGSVAGLVFTLFAVRAFLWPRRKYAAWSYAIRPQDVVVAYGVWWRRRTCIPRLRVQHVDIESGPVERRLGLCHLGVHTAGSVGAVAVIEGLAPEQAEVLRAELIGEATNAHEGSAPTAKSLPDDGATAHG